MHAYAIISLATKRRFLGGVDRCDVEEHADGQAPKIRVLYYNHVMYFEKVVYISLGTTVRLRQQDITSVAVVILCALANRGRHLCYLFFVRVLDGVFFSFFFSARWGVTAVQRLRRGPDKSRKSHSLVNGCREFGWVGFLAVCFLYEINPNPRKKVAAAKGGPNATFNLIFLGLGWPWVGGFVGFVMILICFPTQPSLVYSNRANTRIPLWT